MDWMSLILNKKKKRKQRTHDCHVRMYVKRECTSLMTRDRWKRPEKCRLKRYTSKVCIGQLLKQVIGFYDVKSMTLLSLQRSTKLFSKAEVFNIGIPDPTVVRAVMSIIRFVFHQFNCCYTRQAPPPQKKITCRVQCVRYLLADYYLHLSGVLMLDFGTRGHCFCF